MILRQFIAPATFGEAAEQGHGFGAPLVCLELHGAGINTGRVKGEGILAISGVVAGVLTVSRPAAAPAFAARATFAPTALSAFEGGVWIVIGGGRIRPQGAKGEDGGGDESSE